MAAKNAAVREVVEVEVPAALAEVQARAEGLQREQAALKQAVDSKVGWADGRVGGWGAAVLKSLATSCCLPALGGCRRVSRTGCLAAAAALCMATSCKPTPSAPRRWRPRWMR